MDRVQIRSEVRGVLQETLNFIIEEINEEVETERIKLGRKRKWVKDRVKQDINSYLFPELSKGPTEHFDALQMTEESFNWLLKEVEPYIQKTDTVMRMALPAALKLEIVLHLLTTGTSLRTLEVLFNVSKTSICLMISKVCDAICLALKDYIQVNKNCIL
ncbi:hypothetical protein PYW08_009276 [Mythimna loreyi]|uniref:Uncharacterized protein n=1 Tax=Mythimna loreyi TaxID=667449 RepID=A0ACC2QAT9_9NEOP|nr:hypothetical protein PYW08_009276 [Mythimna loreyi]